MGAVKKKRTIPLSLFYLKYYACLFAGIVLLAGLTVFVFELSVVEGFVYPAYYAQSQAKAAVDELAHARTVEESLIPKLCRYVVFDADGAVKAGNIKGRGIAGAWRTVQGQTPGSSGYYYTVIARDGEYCVLQYEIQPQFRSDTLRKYLPGPQNLLLAGCLCGILLLVVLTAVRFGHTMKKKLAPLIAATKKIEGQELEFSVAHSDIREISAVLQAFDDMRAALKASLESQWRSEQAKREQTLALAHDLKTPLTLARGHTELLYDTPLTQEQRECVGYIEQSVMQMHNYVQTLVEITREGCRPCLRQTTIVPFLQEAAELARGLCRAKGIRLETDISCRPKTFLADRELLLRAFGNVFSNAVEYTKAGGSIFFSVGEEAGWLVCTVADTGSGFTEEALRRGAEQFFMGDESRTSKSHSGIGLYMTDLAMKQHGGTLLLENCAKRGGARVTMRLPCKGD